MLMAAYDEGVNESVTLVLDGSIYYSDVGSPAGALPCAHLPAETGHLLPVNERQR